MKKPIRRALGSLALCAAASLAAPPARADDKATATEYFDAGAQAFDAGQYLVAAEAFLKANEYVKSPAFLFSAAQAYRRQFVLDNSPDSLHKAIQLYRDYLREDPKAKRREDAMAALTDLVPVESRLAGRRSTLSDGGAAGGKPGLVPIDVPLDGKTPSPQPTPSEEPAAPEAQPPRSTRLLLSAKPEGAEVSVDGGAFQRVPAVIEVKPDARLVHVRAPGYFDEEVSVTAVKNELVARHFNLRPKPGRLLVTGPAGARVTIDGQARAALPMESALEIEPGEHFISVTRAGRAPFGQFYSVAQDRDLPIKLDLPMTGQRVAAWSSFGVGLAGAIASGVLAGLMLDREGAASALENDRRAGTLTIEQRDAYNNALTARNDFAAAAGITGGAAALTLLTSFGLFMFDAPDVLPVPPKKKDEKTTSPRWDVGFGLTTASLKVAF